jgi:PIN domain nuclease of toxin-antitoxin system
LLLLDTCTFVWLASEPARLSESASAALDAESSLALSDASAWEICLKWQAGKIVLPSPPRVWISEQMRTWQLERVPIEPDHLYRTVELPELHRDPFDRLLVAQALALGVRIVTPDSEIRRYPVAVTW